MHYRYYSAQTKSSLLSIVEYELVNLVLVNKTLLERWIHRVSLILEKSKRITLVSKLRVILLLEANFNSLNKIIYNCRVMPKLEERRAILCKIIGGKKEQLL